MTETLRIAWIGSVIVSVLILPVHADWPQFRGPQHDGHAPDENLADHWPEAGPPVLWSGEIGQGYSGFAVAEGRAITQSQGLYDQSLVAFDAETGKPLWTLRYGWPYDGGGLYPGPRATPTIHAGRVYFAAPNGLVGCAEAATGRLVWSVNPKEQFRGRGTDFGVSASPVIWKDRVIVPVGGSTASLVALHVDDGRVLWTCGDLPASYATPVLAAFAGHTLILAPLENSLLCAEAETGRKLWELDLSHGYDEHSAAIVYRKPLLMMSGPFRSGARAYRLVPDGEPPGCRPEPVWDAPQFSNDIASSVLVGDLLYGFDLKDAQSRLHRPSRGEFRALDWATGQVRWSSPEPGHANVIAADGKLVLFNDRGEVRLARASADGYEELARTTVFADQICWTPPALADGRLYLRTHQQAVCLYVGRQSLDRSLPSVREIPQATTFDPTVLVGGEREFPAASPEIHELQRWYGWSLAGLMAGAILAGIVSLGLQIVRRAFGRPIDATSAAFVMRGAFWGVVFLWGGLGSAVINARQSEYVFTWPLAVWALMQLAVESSLWAGQCRAERRRGWWARGAGLLFLAGCAVYFHLCRRLGIAIEWAFLTGCLPAFPVAAAVGWVMVRRPRWSWWWPFVGGAISFSVYFGACVLFLRWWLRTGS